MALPPPRHWYAIIVLADSGEVGSEGHRFRSAEEICDVLESMDRPRGVRLLRYEAALVEYGAPRISGP